MSRSTIGVVICLLFLAGCGASKSGGRGVVPQIPAPPKPEPVPQPISIEHEIWSIDPSAARDVIGAGLSVLTSGQFESNTRRIQQSSDTLLLSDQHVYIAEENDVFRAQTSCQGGGCTTILGGESFEIGLSDFYIPASGLKPVMRRSGIDFAQVGDREKDREESYDLFSYGGWLEHNFFFVVTEGFSAAGADSYEELDHWSAVIGKKTGSNPISGGAVWRGAMVGIDVSYTEDRGNRLQGEAFIGIRDFLNPAVDVEFYDVFDLNTGTRRTSIFWQGLPLTGGNFRSKSSEDDYIEGNFYGPNHEEAAGVFEAFKIVGAFGTKR